MKNKAKMPVWAVKLVAQAESFVANGSSSEGDVWEIQKILESVKHSYITEPSQENLDFDLNLLRVRMEEITDSCV